MKCSYKTRGTCSQRIDFDIDGGVVTGVKFTGGCDGNLKAIPILINGWTAVEIAAKLKGVTCGGKSTSCADQLATAVLMAQAKEKEQQTAEQ